MNSQNNNNVRDIFTELEKCCKSPRKIEISGRQVCVTCGADFGSQYVSQGPTAYNAQEIAQKSTHEIPFRGFGPRTFLGQKKQDIRNFSARKRSRFYRLAKIQGSLIGSVERNLTDAKPVLKGLAEELNLPTHVKETAWMIYEKVAENQLTMGRSIHSFVVASTYIAIRVHEFPKLIDHVVSAAALPMKTLLSAIALVNDNILPEMGLHYSHNTNIPLVIGIITQDLGLSSRVLINANKIYKYLRNRGMRNIGHNPKGIAAAIVYYAAKRFGEKRTQQEIADAAFITEVTLRSRLKEIRELLPNDE